LANPDLARHFTELGKIPINDGADERADDRGAGPLIFSMFRRDVGRKRDVNVEVAFGDQAANRLFVCCVGLGVKETDGDRVDALLFDQAVD
jgi:hypothetical protein